MHNNWERRPRYTLSLGLLIELDASSSKGIDSSPPVTAFLFLILLFREALSLGNNQILVCLLSPFMAGEGVRRKPGVYFDSFRDAGERLIRLLSSIRSILATIVDIGWVRR